MSRNSRPILYPKGCPSHMRDKNLHVLIRLQSWGNSIRAYYGVPVYLTGSAMRDDNPVPRDWDVRLCLPDARFAAVFGDPEEWKRQGDSGDYTTVRWRWSDECTKRSREGHKATGVNVDFQIYPTLEWVKYLASPSTYPKMQIDTRWAQFQEERKRLKKALYEYVDAGHLVDLNGDHWVHRMEEIVFGD